MSAKKSTSRVVPPGPIAGFEIVSDAEMAKIKRREKEYKHMQAKLADLNELKRERKLPGLQISKQNNNLLRSAISHKEYVQAFADYVHALVDPFNAQGAKIPTTSLVQTSTFTVSEHQQFETTTTDIPGTFRGLFPCHWAGLWAASGTGTKNTQPAITAGHEYVSSTSGATSNWPSIGTYTLQYDTTPGQYDTDIWSVKSFNPSRQYDSISQLYSFTRMVSAGIEVTYTGAPLDAKGRIAVAMLPPGQGPRYPNNAVAASPNLMMDAGEEWDFSFDAVSSLPGARVLSASEPIRQVIVPISGGEAEEFCPTAYVSSLSSVYVNSGAYGSTGAPPIWEAPEQAMATADAAMMMGMAADAGGATAAVQCGLLSSAMLFQLTNVSSVFGRIVIVGEGLDTAATLDVRVVGNFEAIPRARTLSMTSPVSKSVGLHETHRELARRTVEAVATHKEPSSVGDKLVNGLRKFVRGANSAMAVPQIGSFVAKVLGDVGIPAEAITVGTDLLAGAAFI